MVLKENKKIILHACCAVCLAHSWVKLNELGYDNILVYFFNPNIFPYEELIRRQNELISFCKKKNYKFLIENETSDNWRNYIKGLECEPEKGTRCNLCFEYRLLNTAKKAKELKFNEFTTTLSISPHKISKNIFSIGDNIAKKFNLNFLKIDFKKENGFFKTNLIAKENNLYRQTYCGCEFSIK